MACDRAALSSVLLVTVSFCQAHASCIMLCSMQVCTITPWHYPWSPGHSPPGAAQRKTRYGPRTPRVLPRHADAEPRGALCAERDGGGAMRRRADPSPPGDTWHPTSAVSRWSPSGSRPPRSAPLRKGRGVLIEGRLQWRRWEQDGQYRCTREVIAERIQCLSRPQAGAEVAGVGAPRAGGDPGEGRPRRIHACDRLWDVQ